MRGSTIRHRTVYALSRLKARAVLRKDHEQELLLRGRILATTGSASGNFWVIFDWP